MLLLKAKAKAWSSRCRIISVSSKNLKLFQGLGPARMLWGLDAFSANIERSQTGL